MSTAPAIGYSIVANLGDERQITLQHFIGDDESDDKVHAAMDRIMACIDRQKARLRIPELKLEKQKLEGELAMAERDRTAIELDHQHKDQARDRAILELRSKGKEIHDDGYNKHVASGRVGPFVPQGQAQSRLAAIESDVGKIVQAAINDAQERDVALANLDHNLKMRRLRITQIDDQLVDLNARVT